MKVFLPKSKVDQLMKGRWMHVDEVKGSNTCPVKLMRRWCKYRGGRGEDWFFCGAKGRQLSVSGVSGVVKNMVKEVGRSEKVSGHSLRIAGATLAVKAGLSMAEICAVGGWRSDAVLAYLRDMVVAKKKASKALGF